MHRVFNQLADFLYPPRCPVCDNVLPPPGGGICEGCRARIEYVREPRCSRCGKPLEDEEEFCQDCRTREAAYICGKALLVYDSYMQDSMAYFKYGGRKEYAVFYAAELYRVYQEWICRVGADALVPVPIHKKRLRKRGYNQADLLAVELGRLTNIPVRQEILCRRKDTLPQKELSGVQRRRNLEGAFQLRNSTEELNQLPECVIIIDDIYTTGSTVEACAQVLKRAGLKSIYFLCLCIGRGY